MDWLLELPLPLVVGIIIAVEIGFFALVIFILKKLGINVLGGFSRTVMLQGLKNALFTFLIIGMLVAGMAIVPVMVFGRSIWEGLVYSFGIIWIVAIFGFLFTFATHKQKAGPLLVDIAPFPNRWVLILSSVVVVIGGFSNSFDFVTENTKYSYLISVVMGLFMGGLFIIMSLGRIQIYENGILAYWSLIKWGRIESFRWVDDHGKSPAIQLKYNGKMPSFLRNGAIPIPIEKKAQVETLLEQFLQK